jgi:hypothetical protein
MPGAPNRPPENAPPPPAPAVDPPARLVLRRLAPSRVALLLDPWKGTPSPELTGPLERAETAYAGGDFAGATNALDLLSVRFAEPRWPTLPEPFRTLRVAIPAPMPPHWDPDHALGAPERDAKRARRVAEDQLALASGSVAWLAGHAAQTEDLAPRLEEARAILATEGAGAAFYERIDAIWEGVRARAPMPRSGTVRPSATAPAAPPTETGEA